MRLSEFSSPKQYPRNSIPPVSYFEVTVSFFGLHRAPAGCPDCQKVDVQARKTNPNLNFGTRTFSGGVGVFHTKGWGPKSSVCPSKPGKSNFFGGISRDFAGISRGRPKSLGKKKVWVQFSFPKIQSRLKLSVSIEIFNLA